MVAESAISVGDLAQVSHEQQVLEVRGDRREVLQRLERLLAALRVPRAQRRREDLLQQRRLAVGRGAQHAQVAPADAVAGELRDRADDLALGLVVVLRAGADLALDDAEVLQLGHQRRLRLRLLEHVVERVQRPALLHRDRRPAARLDARRGDVGRAAPGRELLADHAQRQELVALQPQDRAQPRDVGLAVEPIAARRAPRRQQLLILEVADLRDRDVGELLLERLADGPDRHRLARRLVALVVGHLDVLFAHAHRARKVSLNLPICSSSPSLSRWLSMRCRLTYVPFNEPRSSMWIPSPRRTISAWSRETVMSSRKMSQSGRLPTVMRSLVIGKLSPTRPPPARITSAAPSSVTTSSSSTGISSPVSPTRYVAVLLSLGSGAPMCAPHREQ